MSFLVAAPRLDAASSGCAFGGTTMSIQRDEVVRLSLAVKSTIEELQKQDYAVVDAILREIDRRLDRLAATKAA
jgi:hypothetical protein